MSLIGHLYSLFSVHKRSRTNDAGPTAFFCLFCVYYGCAIYGVSKYNRMAPNIMVIMRTRVKSDASKGYLKMTALTSLFFLSSKTKEKNVNLPLRAARDEST